MKKEIKSIMPLYGGKSKMAHFIADRLDYDNTSVFVTPFGGACRVLLNKRPHDAERYNDRDAGLCAVMQVLSEKESAEEFIARLFYETEYSEEEFEKQRGIYETGRTDFEREYRTLVREFLIENEIVSPVLANRYLDSVQSAIEYKKKKRTKGIDKADIRLIEKSENNKEFKKDLTNHLNNWKRLIEAKEENNLLHTCDAIGIKMMDLAIACYVVYTQSRDGMGTVFSHHKFKNQEQYKKHILKLYDCAERLEGIFVSCADSMGLFCYADDSWNELMKDTEFYRWTKDESYMLMCDPSYISPGDEWKLLRKTVEGIPKEEVTAEDIWNKIEHAESVSELIEKAYPNGRMPKNLGKIYAASFGYKEHERFLKSIQKAKSKILVCNYDLLLYHKYLTPENGWSYEEYRTTTSVGMKKKNTRVEVIWKNY